MAFVSCLDIFNEMSKEFMSQHKNFKEDKEKSASMKGSCVMIDLVAKRNYGVGFDVSIDEDTREIIVSVICESVQVENRVNVFYEAVLSAKKVEIFVEDDDEEHYLEISFHYDGIWTECRGTQLAEKGRCLYEDQTVRRVR